MAVFKKKLCRMKAVSGIGEMIYVYFQDSTYSKNFPGTVFFFWYYVFQTGVVKAATDDLKTSKTNYAGWKLVVWIWFRYIFKTIPIIGTSLRLFIFLTLCQCCYNIIIMLNDNISIFQLAEAHSQQSVRPRTHSLLNISYNFKHI